MATTSERKSGFGEAVYDLTAIAVIVGALALGLDALD